MILEKIQKANDIKDLQPEELKILADEIRQFLIEKISVTGGHLASNLGVVELTMALHLVFDLPDDKLIWDVGHQSYTHKLLTGRKAGFDDLRKYGGMSGFPKRKESDCDAFDTGHSSTSVSAGLGYVAAPVEFIQAMVRVHQYINTCASSFVQEAAITALEKGEPDVQRMVAEYQRRRDYAVSAINSIDGISCKNPEGAFYIFVNIKALGRSSSEVADYLLDHAHIATVPGSAFGPSGEGYIRLTAFGGADATVEAVERICKVL